MIEMIMTIPENYLIPEEWPVLLIFGVPALVLFVVGCVIGLQRYALQRDGVAVQGHVVEIEMHEHRSKDREGNRTTSVSYYPVIEFAAAGGAKYRFTGSIPKGLLKYSYNSSVTVLYDPKDPSTARIAHFAEFWAEPLYYGLPGFLTLAFCIGLFFYHQNRLASELAGDAEIRREQQNENKLHRENEIRRIMADGTVLRLNGVVESVRKQQGASGEEYVVVCWATRPGETSRERYDAAPISFHPGPAIIGKSVEIYVHREDKTRYQLDLDDVLEELQAAKR